MAQSLGGCCRRFVVAGWAALLVGSDAAAQRLPPRLATSTEASARTTDVGGPAGRRAAAAPRVPVGAAQCGRDVRCRIAEMKQQGTNPLLYAPSADLIALGSSRPVHATICVCRAAELICLKPETSWLDSPAPAPIRFTEIRINRSLAAVNYLLAQTSLEFRIRWSTSLDSATWDSRNVIDSDGVLTYVGGSRPVVSTICRE